MNTAKFPLGQTVMTPGVQALVVSGALRDPADIIHRHQNGDWDDLDDEDKQANNQAIKNGARILSSYHIQGEKIWVITEWDRSVTTILLPEEY